MKLSLLFVAAPLVALTMTRPASAADGDVAREEAPSPQPPTERAAAPRPWLYLDDPTVAAPLHVTAAMRATYTDASSPTRPFAANTARPGGALEAGGEGGLLPRLAIAASGFTTPDASSVGAIAAVRVDVLPRAWQQTHAVVSGGWLREIGGADGVWGRVTFAQDIGRLRIGTTLHGEHVLARGRDGIDVMMMAGASYRVLAPLRAVVEYVAQDLEGAFDDDEAEKGVRHFVGPTLETELLDRRLTIVGGPAFGLTPQSPSVVGRLALAYSY